MSKHTPGPWKTGQQSDGEWLVHAAMGGPGRTVLARLILDDYGSQVGMNEANAKLIAAAPELLAACELAAEFFKTKHKGRVGEISAWIDIHDAVKAAIAKAQA